MKQRKKSTATDRQRSKKEEKRKRDYKSLKGNRQRNRKKKKDAVNSCRDLDSILSANGAKLNAPYDSRRERCAQGGAAVSPK